MIIARVKIQSSARTWSWSRRELCCLRSPRAARSRKTYATQTSLGKLTAEGRERHKPVTVFNDDGRVKWGDLSPMEKVARTTQQSVNLSLILGGASATVCMMYTERLSRS